MNIYIYISLLTFILFSAPLLAPPMTYTIPALDFINYSAPDNTDSGGIVSGTATLNFSTPSSSVIDVTTTASTLGVFTGVAYDTGHPNTIGIPLAGDFRITMDSNTNFSLDFLYNTSTFALIGISEGSSSSARNVGVIDIAPNGSMAVPEPSTYAALGGCLFISALAFARKRRLEKRLVRRALMR